MQTVRKILVATVVPALLVTLFAVSSVAANGSAGKVELCHWANHKFVEITVSMSAEPAHLRHGDVREDEYGDCSSDESQTDEDSDGDSEDEDAEADQGSHDDGDEADAHDGKNHHSNRGDDGEDD